MTKQPQFPEAWTRLSSEERYLAMCEAMPFEFATKAVKTFDETDGD